MKSRHRWVGFGVILILVSVSFLLAGCQRQVADSAESEVPTVLIHGSPGSNRSFDTMVDLLQDKTSITEEPLMEVTSSGKLVVHGTWKTGKHPVVVVRFDDSTADEDKRSEWLATCMRYLYQELNIKKVNLVGHSMGGIDSFYYATRYQYRHPNLPRVNKVVSLGAPFNGCEASENGNAKTSSQKGPKIKSKDYQTYAALAKKYPIKVGGWLNIAGDKLGNGEGDLIVPLGSVTCIEPLMKEQKVNYREEIFVGDEHSELHDDEKVIDLMIKYLWQ